MRPINKGASPYSNIQDYPQALPYLVEKIGAYCSYCGFPIKHVPEVEHVVAKANGGPRTAWSNLLLGCKYCNARKLATVTPDNVDEYLWPDMYNTALAFTYKNGIPKVNTDMLSQIEQPPGAQQMAQKLFDLVKLGNIPDAGDKDRRFATRNKAYELARDSLNDWNSCRCEQMLRQIVRTAQENGFFSVWATVFENEPDVLNELIAAFPGTRREFFDELGHPQENLVVFDYT